MRTPFDKPTSEKRSKNFEFIEPHQNNVIIQYLGDVFDWHGYIKFLSLAALRDTSQDVPLEKLFVEPHVSAEHLTAELLETSSTQTESLTEALQHAKRMLLLGDPGSGKSTAVNWICTSLCRTVTDVKKETFGKNYIPIPFVLRDLNLGQEFLVLKSDEQRWELLLDQFLARPVACQLKRDREMHHDFSRCILGRMLSSGQAFLIFDGIDELGNIEMRKALRGAISKAILHYPWCPIIMTSRIVGHEEVPFDFPFGDEVRHLERVEGTKYKSRIQNLKKSSVARRQLNFDALVEWPVRRYYLTPFNDKQIERFTCLWWANHESNPHLAGTKPKEFLNALRQSKGANSLARLPHLLTMIALIYRVRAELPDGRALLYGFIADAYLGTLDKERHLEHLRPIPHSVEEMHRWLAAVGWYMQKRRGKIYGEVLVDREQLLEVLEGVIRSTNHSGSGRVASVSARQTAELFLEYAGRRSGLLLPRGQGADGQNRYAFLHLSFQEYFAAQFLREIVCDPDWADLENENRKLGAGLVDLRGYIENVLWRETLIFLWESISSASAILPQRLIQKVFDWPRNLNEWPNFKIPSQDELPAFGGEWDTWAHRSGVLRNIIFIATLSVNPHVSLNDEARRMIWKKSWIWEFEERKWHLGRNMKLIYTTGDSIPQTLLSRHQYCEDAFISAVDVLKVMSDTKHVCLPGCDALTHLNGLEQATQLESLSLSGCVQLKDCSALGQLPKLIELWLDNCAQIKDFSFLTALKNLSRLSLAGCHGFLDLSPLEKMFNLTRLNLNGCKGVKNLACIGSLQNLRVISLTDCDQIEDLSPLYRIKSLSKLTMISPSEINKKAIARFRKFRPEVKVVEVNQSESDYE